MALTNDELFKVLGSLARCHIDLSQGMNAYLHGNLKGGNLNFADVLKNLAIIMREATD